jgi:hypothetical protein
MPDVLFVPLSAEFVARVRAGGPDDNGQPAERMISDGEGVPCRASLRGVPKGAPYLVCAHRPFAGLNPYTECGPIFLSVEGDIPDPSGDLPAMLASPSYIVRGYDADERIVYGTGRVTPTGEIRDYAAELLGRDDIAFVHVRSASNNCFQVRVERAD